MSKKRIIFSLIVLISLVVNGALLYHHVVKNSESIAADNAIDLQKRYPLLSKRIMYDFPQDILINFLDLRKELRQEVEPYGNTFGFYFEYLPTGTSIGVNEKEEFFAASLFKVPVIMAYYKGLERQNSLKDLDKEVEIEKGDVDKQFGELWQLGAGTRIKMSEAVRLALEESDNTAAKVIARRVIEDDFNSVYEGLDIELQTASGGAILTAKNYTSILKALYFSSVLEKESSTEILKYLTQSKFNAKLVAGVPKDVVVSHKIGEYKDGKGDTAYMDCGIVYVPRRPYTLCMLSVGDEETANQRMSKVSKMIYDYVSSVK